MSTFWESTDLNAKVDPMHAARTLGQLMRLANNPDPISNITGPDVAPTDPATSTAEPVGDAPVSQGYGAANDHEAGHPGVDFAVPVGTPVLSAITGTVTVASGNQGGYGNLVEIRSDDGTITRYGHLSAINVAPGATVKAGTPIGVSGGQANAEGAGNSTGPHLHFEVHDPSGALEDPVAFLAGGATILGKPGTPAASTTPQSGQIDVAAPLPQDVVDTIHGPGTTATADTTIASGLTGSDSDPGAVDAFLSATRTHESGGDYTIRNQSGQSNAAGAYQFLGSTWKGLGGSTESAAEASPAEQDVIARRYALQLFNQFHSWRLVAIAWYGGPSVAAQVAAGKDPGAPSGQGPYAAYGDTIARMMSGG